MRLTASLALSAADFGIVKGGQKLAGTTFYIQNVHSLTLPVTQGLQVVTPWYGDESDAARAFTARWRAEMKTDRADPSACRHVQRGPRLSAGRAGGRHGRVARGLRQDAGASGDRYGLRAGLARAGRRTADFHLVEVKSPAESKGPWDYSKILAELPAAEIIRPLDQGHCPDVVKN